MWHSQVEESGVNNAVKMSLWKDNHRLSFGDVIDCWKTDVDFRTFFNALLAAADYKAFFWEVPPMTKDRLNSPFEFVLVNAIFLSSVQAEREDFTEHFTDVMVVNFPNLSGDAHLVVPCPQTADNHYTHLANFVRQAEEEQQQQFWQKVGEVYEQQLGDAPKWLSTSGLGVYWLHVRIDSRPKYYQYTPYK